MPRPRSSHLKPVNVNGFKVPMYRLGDGRTAFYDKYGGPRKMFAFKDEEKARAEAEKLALRVLRGEAVRHEFTPADIAIYRRMHEIIVPTNVPMASALQEWMAAHKLCDGRPMLDVVRRGIEVLSVPAKTFSEVATMFLTEKRMANLSGIYLAELEEDLEMFCKAFGTLQIAEITPEQIGAAISAPTTKEKMRGPRRRNNLRATLVTLFRYAQTRKPAFLPPGPTSPQLIPKVKIRKGAVSVYTPQEMQFWLSQVKDEFLPWLVIGGFSGIRTEEICPGPDSNKDRLRWDDFNWKKRHINIRPEVAKTNERRLVPILDNLYEWLVPFQGKTGPVVPLGLRTDRESERLNRVSKRLTSAMARDPKKYHHPCPGLTWRHNALRHSAASYRMAIIKNAPQVAYEFGNSVAMIKRHYHEAQEEDHAKQYYAIMPGDAALNTVQLDLVLAG